jgi:hypothetical protein
MNIHAHHHRSILQSNAHRAMPERGLLSDYSDDVLAELGQIQSST